MIDGHTVSETEHGLVRVFTLLRSAALPNGEALSIEEIAEALGVDALNSADVQQIWTDALDGMPLQELLSAGCGIEDDEVECHEVALEGAMEMQPNLLVIIRSSAFEDRPAHLSEGGPLNLIATLREPDASVSFAPLPNPDPAAALQDAPQKKRPSDAAMSGRVATVALLVMALLVWVMIKVAG